jgi:hypothetical protein
LPWNLVINRTLLAFWSSSIALTISASLESGIRFDEKKH